MPQQPPLPLLWSPTQRRRPPRTKPIDPAIYWAAVRAAGRHGQLPLEGPNAMAYHDPRRNQYTIRIRRRLLSGRHFNASAHLLTVTTAAEAGRTIKAVEHVLAGCYERPQPTPKP